MEKIKILVVDDEEEIREFSASHIRDAFRDYEIVVYASGELAWHDVEGWGQKTHIAITDYRMPGMNGIALLKKTKERHPEIKFLVMSGDDIEELALASKADAFLKKPFSFAQLIRAVDKLL